jgi:anthranilate phosphoribosyltransferase
MSTDHNGESVVDVEALSQAAADAGLAALDGKEGAAKDCLLYSAAIVLKHLGKAESLEQGADLAAQAIASGQAKQCFKNS